MIFSSRPSRGARTRSAAEAQQRPLSLPHCGEMPQWRGRPSKDAEEGFLGKSSPSPKGRGGGVRGRVL